MNKHYSCTTARRAVAALTLPLLCGLSARAQAPVNDLPVNAITITVDQPCTAPYTNVGATVDAGEPDLTCNSQGKIATVWFKFVAPASGAVKISTDFEGYTLQSSRMVLYAVGDAANYSTFSSLACDEGQGITGLGRNNILYTAGLTAGVEYYIVVDKATQAVFDPGTFCLEVSTLTDAMLPATASCTDGKVNMASFSTRNWISLIDNEGKLIANVRINSSDTSVGYYAGTSSLNINGGALRYDTSGQAYLDRSSFYHIGLYDANYNPLPAGDMDLQLFFTQAELTALGTPLSNLTVTHSPDSACAPDLINSSNQSILQTTGSGTSGNASWINITTPGFSNFYVMSGTTPLPIELISITATNTGSSNRIDWSSGREDAGEYFELERSADSKTFGFLDKVAGKGPGSAYTYRDRSPLKGTGYYRLKMINNDGKIKYSKIVEAARAGNEAFSFTALPNPVRHTLWVTFGGDRGDKAVLSLSDATGKTLRTYAVTGNMQEIDMSSLAPGLYILRYADGSRTETMKVHKQ